MDQKHYMDIERMNPLFIDGFRRGDRIVVQEKIDGANFSIRYDAETNTVKSFSRKKELDLSNNLRGAWNWAQELNVDTVKRILGNDFVLFGEWLVKHTVKYPNECYNKAYFYDVYDVKEQVYLHQRDVKWIVESLGLTYVPVFYDGEFTTWDALREYVGRTELGGEYGEGIVVKNQTRLNDPNIRIPFYTKIVCEQFCETKGKKEVKQLSPEEMADRALLQELTESIVTEARVTKLVHKLVDDGIIPVDWTAHDMANIAKNIGKNTYEDCIKEEPEIVKQIGDKFGKYASSTAMGIVRKMLQEREQF